MCVDVYCGCVESHNLPHVCSGSWDIDCSGGACLSKSPDAECDVKDNFCPYQSLCEGSPGHDECTPTTPRPMYGCNDMTGRPLTLNSSHTATASTHWVQNSSWVAADPTPVRSHSCAPGLPPHSLTLTQPSVHIPLAT